MSSKKWCFCVKDCLEKDENISTYWSDRVQYITIGTREGFNLHGYYKILYGFILFKVEHNKKELEEINSHVKWKMIDEKKIRLRQVLFEIECDTDFHESMGSIGNIRTPGGVWC